MTIIATLAEFAYVIGLDPSAVGQRHELLLDLAEGLVIEEIGVQDPWPASAKSVALAAAARPHFNPQGTSSEALGDMNRSFPDAHMGVYLTDDEIGRLHSPNRGPAFEFPGSWPYPDPVEQPADTVAGP